MIAAEIHTKGNGITNFLNLWISRTAYLLLALPLGIVSFVVTVTFMALGIGLMPLGIGFFIYWFALAAADRLRLVDAVMLAKLIRRNDGSEVNVPTPQSIMLRRIFVEKSYYNPVVYNLVKLPISVLQFAVVVTFVVCGFAMLFTPLVYVILDRVGIPMFDNDLVMTLLFPNLSPYHYSFVGTAIGVIFLVIGMVLMPKLLRLTIAMLKD